ncbi:MAG: DUF1735 domain-containing protein [Prevotella sp.]|jgi:hypothetical protein|nr:DUF1735 domain-containing protein [Prevotella sp.]
MKRNILKFICGIGLVCGLWSCENGNKTFPDFEDGTTVYFPYQYPTRTIVLGDDEPSIDLTNDHNHQCQIMATFGGSYNGSNGSVQVAVDESLCDNLYFEDGVTPVKAMPSSYYSLSTTNLNFNGTFNGTTTVQLTDAFFNDPDAVGRTYVIPLVMTSQTGFGKILTGTLNEGETGPRTNSDAWDIKPMDFVLYCVKFQNKYSGFWLTNGTTSTDNIEQASSVEIKTLSLDDCSYEVSFQDGDKIYTANLKLSFAGGSISSLTDGVTATGTCSWGDDTEKKAWGNRDRDGMELNYTITFADGKSFSKQEKLVWQRSGVKPVDEFTPVYKK